MGSTPKTTSAHTAGSLRFQTDENGENTRIVDSEGNILARCDSESTARLLAAAPELLAACKVLLACPELNLDEMDSRSVDAVAVGLAAVSKAEGHA